MSTTDYAKNGLLLECFNDFYSKVISLKEKINNGSWLTKIGGTVNNRQDLLKAAQSIKEELLSLFDQQKAIIYRTGGEYLTNSFDEVLYIMVSLADEVFLSLNWEGKSVWFAILLEAHLFKTRAAGEIIFSKLDQFLAQNDHSKKELAEIYLLTLSLGFEGRFRGNADCGKSIDQYKNRLFFYLYACNSELNKTNRVLIPQTKEFTITETPIKYLKYKSKSIHFFSLAMIVLLILSFFVWHFAVVDIYDSLIELKAIT